MSRNNGVTYKKNKDGTENKLYVDLLDEDKPISNQKFACVSFVSPEDLLKKKDIFMFEEFVKKWDLATSINKFTQFLSFISYKYDIEMMKLTEDMKQFVEDEKAKLLEYSVLDDYKTFIDNNESELQKEFDKAHNFQTSVRGLKIRGSFPSLEEAEFRCKLLREQDPYHDVYVAQVGAWLPFHPVAYKTGRVEYLEEELNQLFMEKKKNEECAKEEFDKRVREEKRKSIEENVRKARESNNLLSQTIDENDNLVGITNTTSQYNFLSSNENVSEADIINELFVGDVVTGESDHGLSLLNVPEPSEPRDASFGHNTSDEEVKLVVNEPNDIYEDDELSQSLHVD